MTKITLSLNDFNKQEFNKYNSRPVKVKGKAIPRAEANGYKVQNSTQAHIANNIYKIEKELLTGKIANKVNISANSKTKYIFGISFPNIFQQVQFMALVKANPQLLEMRAVRILHDYFKANKVCLNCSNCIGLCYNNKASHIRPTKATSDLRTLLAYIVDKDGLANKIQRSSKFFNVFRINLNGEIHTTEMIEFWMNIAKLNKWTRFYTYTKSYQLFSSWLNDGNEFPENFFLNTSVMDNAEFIKSEAPELWSKVQKFEAVTKFTRGNKYRCKGDCSRCDFCYSNLGADTTIEVLAH